MIWLASGSPRRRDLLQAAGFSLSVHPPDIDERALREEHPKETAERLAHAKAHCAPEGEFSLGADTIVHLNGQILGKPQDRDMAAQHLTQLSGRWHEVTTAVCVRHARGCQHIIKTTRVRFRVLTSAEIERYLQSGEADDKAGAYGIQGQAASFVAEVQGSWTNVVGLPLEECIEGLKAHGMVPHAS